MVSGLIWTRTKQETGSWGFDVFLTATWCHLQKTAFAGPGPRSRPGWWPDHNQLPPRRLWWSPSALQRRSTTESPVKAERMRCCRQKTEPFCLFAAVWRESSRCSPLEHQRNEGIWKMRNKWICSEEGFLSTDKRVSRGRWTSVFPSVWLRFIFLAFTANKYFNDSETIVKKNSLGYLTSDGWVLTGFPLKDQIFKHPPVNIKVSFRTTSAANQSLNCRHTHPFSFLMT